MAGNSKFTKKRIDIILNELRNGNYVTTACKRAGINPNTYYKWVKEYPEDPDRADRQKYIDFKEAVEAAEADGEARLLQKLQDASEEPRNWTAAAWILERKYRDKWSRNDRSEINVTGTINHKVDVRQKINDQLARISTRQDEGGGSVKPEGGGGD